jgi:arabinofuranan 3-O-arabinosyltransferase
MTASDTLLPAKTPTDPARLVAVIGLALSLSYVVFLLGSLAQGHWIVDAQGRVIANDFVNLFAAGKLALAGDAARAYDWTAQRDVEVAVVGHAFEGFYPWSYPPSFLFPAALLAMLPIIPASLMWLAATGAGYIAALRAILGTRPGVLFACGFPAALWNVTAGQNGFFTAALIGGALTMLERQPLLAGACIGALSCKPQLGVLFPLVLAASGRWRAFAAAAVAAMALATASWIAFGGASWAAFFNMLPSTGLLTFDAGGAGFNKLQSAFGLVRLFGGSAALAWTIQGVLAGAVTVSLVLTWRSWLPFDLKAGAFAAGALLVTPYLFIYDLAALAVPAAFLLRFSLAHGALTSELLGLAAACGLLLSYIVFPSPVGFIATLIIAALIGRRILTCAHHLPTLDHHLAKS